MPKISISVSTNKTLYWQRLCESLAQNSIDMEVMFIGPVPEPHKISLPIPVRFFTTDVNPALCWEIGARKATGELLCFLADDCIFSPECLDDAWKASRVMGEYDMVTAHYFERNVDKLPNMRMMSNQNMPLLPVCGFLFTASHHKIGGIDRRFQAVLWDVDLYQRFIWAGGKTILLENHVIHELGDESRMWQRNAPHDMPILENIWSSLTDPKTGRVVAVESYTDEEVAVVETNQ
jgi:hypothetical protein